MHYEDPKNIRQTIEVIKLDQVQLQLPRNSTQQNMLFSQMVLSWSSFIQIGKPSLCQQSGKKPKILNCPTSQDYHLNLFLLTARQPSLH